MKIIQTAEGLVLKVSEVELDIIYVDLFSIYKDNEIYGIESPIRKEMLKTIRDHHECPF